MIYETDALTVFFGGERERFTPSLYKKIKASYLLQEAPFVDLKNSMKIRALFFLHQVHGTSGIAIDDHVRSEDRYVFEDEGDFLCTDLYEIGIAVATADCLPIILYDTRHNAVSVIHAGWRGAVAGIVVSALTAMSHTYGTQGDDLHVFFGPSAGPCCYAVGGELVTQVMRFGFGNDVLYDRGKTFFDLPRFNQLLLQEQGVQQEAFNTRYNLCTICDTSFCSYRRQQDVYRQMTVVSLKNKS